MSRPLRVLLRIGVVLALSAAGAEIGSRVRDHLRKKPWDAAAVRSRIEEECRSLSHPFQIQGGHQDEDRLRELPGSPILHPYAAWSQLLTQGQIADDLDLLRRPESKEVFDIYILGGSVAHGFASMGAAPLVASLKRDPRFEGKEIRVHNYSVWGYKQLQQLTLLAYLLDLGQQPDAVIELDGLNEAAQGWINARAGTNPLYPSVSYWAKATVGLRPQWDFVEALCDLRAAQDRAADFGTWLIACPLWHGSFLGQVGLARFESLYRAYAQAHRQYMRTISDSRQNNGLTGPRFPDDDAGLARRIRVGWEQSSISMHAMCAAKGITYLHVLQPTLHDKGSKPLTAKEIDGSKVDPDWIEGVARVYDSMRESGKRLAARGVPFCDASGVFRDHPEDIYYDVCHFKEHGNEILAAAVATALLEALRR